MYVYIFYVLLCLLIFSFYSLIATVHIWRLILKTVQYFKPYQFVKCIIVCTFSGLYEQAPVRRVLCFSVIHFQISTFKPRSFRAIISLVKLPFLPFFTWCSFTIWKQSRLHVPWGLPPSISSTQRIPVQYCSERITSKELWYQAVICSVLVWYQVSPLMEQVRQVT